MHIQVQYLFKYLILISLLLVLTACTAGDTQFTTESPAGFWYGIWHGAIAVITLIIHLFNDSVMVYETNNSGGWYDFGFLLGVIFVWGGGCHVKCKTKEQKKRDREWDEIGDKVEKKIMREMKNWAQDEPDSEAGQNEGSTLEDWDEIWPKVEKKLKRKIREWADKE